MIREIILDTETTGLSPREGHRVVEIGCVELMNHLPTGEVYHEYFNPQRDMPSGAFDIHGLSEEFLSTKKLFRDHAEDFLEFISDATLIIHNAPFDIGFLNHEFDLIGMGPLEMSRVEDTLAMAKKKHPGGKNSLDALCRRYSIDNSGRTKHGALLDSELLAEVYLELIGGAQPHLTLVDKTENTVVRTQSQTPLKPRPNQLQSRLTDQDKEDHQAFVDDLGADALWQRFYDKT